MHVTSSDLPQVVYCCLPCIHAISSDLPKCGGIELFDLPQVWWYRVCLHGMHATSSDLPQVWWYRVVYMACMLHLVTYPKCGGIELQESYSCVEKEGLGAVKRHLPIKWRHRITNPAQFLLTHKCTHTHIYTLSLSHTHTKTTTHKHHTYIQQHMHNNTHIIVFHMNTLLV